MLLIRYYDKSSITIDPRLEIGLGGEARIYRLQQEPKLVAKIYHEPTNEKARKLIAMIENPPDDPMASVGLMSIAWPIDLLSDSGHIVGFLMPRAGEMRTIIDFYNPSARLSQCPLFNYLYLHHTARNLTSAVRALHERGYVIGDVNESNILVSETALVTLVDTDSFQVPSSHDGIIYRCPVGKPEYTPPELQGSIFSNIDRTPEHDLFGLAVLIFQLLMEGTHPFAGIYRGSGDPPLYADRILNGHFTYSVNKRVPYRPAKIAQPIEILHPKLKQLFIQCFEDGHIDPQARPNARTWQDTLDEAEKELINCSVNNQHFYGKHLSDCPWCERAKQLSGHDPFPSKEEVLNQQHIKKSTPIRKPQRKPALTVYRPTLSITRYNAYRSQVLPRWQKYLRITVSVVISLIIVSIINGVTRVNTKDSALKILEGHSNRISSISFSPNMNILASGSNDSTIRLWDTETGEQIKLINGEKHSSNQIPFPYSRTQITCVAYSHDGKILASGSSWLERSSTLHGEINLWDTKTWNLLRVINDFEGAILTIAFSPDNKILASGGSDKMIRFWDMQKGELIRILKGHEYDVNSVAFSPDNRFLASGSADNSVRIWNARTGELHLILLKRYVSPITCVAFSPKERILVSGCYDKTARIWDLDTGGIKKILMPHDGVVTSVAFSPDGSTIATGSKDTKIRLWNAINGSEKTIYKGHTDEITCIAFSPDGKILATSGGKNDRTIRFWKMKTKSLLTLP